MSHIQAVSNGEIEPDLMRRSCGGWLAVAPKGGIFSIGVTAPTADDARRKFGTTMQRWLEILAAAKSDAITGT